MPASSEGGYQEIIKGINDTLDAVVGPLNVAAEYVDRIGKGEIPARITENYAGDFGEIKNSLNACIDGLAGLEASNAVLQRMAVNDYTTRVDGSYRGAYADVAMAVNAVQDRLLSLQSTATRMANGDLSDLERFKQAGNGKGKRSENDQLLPAFIDMIEAVKNLVDETVALSEAAKAGRLATRAETGRFKGEYLGVIRGVNETLDAVIGPLKPRGRICGPDQQGRDSGQDHGQLQRGL